MRKMFLFKSGCMLVMLFSVVHSQMDVILKRTTPTPITYDELSSPRDADLISDNINQDMQEMIKRHEKIQDDLRKIGFQIDSGIDHKFDIFPQPLNPTILDRIFNDQQQTQDKSFMPPFGLSLNSEETEEDSNSDEENPILNAFKLMDDSMNLASFGPGISFVSDPISSIDPKIPNMAEGNIELQPVGVLTIIRIDDDAPRQDNVNSPTINGDMTTTPPVSDIESSFLQEFVKGFMSTMKDMVDLVRNTSISLNASEMSKQNKSESPIDIKIKDHGRTYDIPQDAYIERSNPEMVNITWRSELKGFNNSLCMNVSKDADGQIVFHHIRLRILNSNDRQGVQEYNSEDPVRVGQSKDNSTEINLADGIGLRFSNPDSLDVVVVEKRRKLSAQWMAVSIALLGLLVAGLVMFLSYILHTRNRYYARKDSMSKQPIA